MSTPWTHETIAAAESAARARIQSLNLDSGHRHKGEQTIVNIAESMKDAVAEGRTIDPVAFIREHIERVNAFEQRFPPLPAWQIRKQAGEMKLAIECLCEAMHIDQKDAIELASFVDHSQPMNVPRR